MNKSNYIRLAQSFQFFNKEVEENLSISELKKLTPEELIKMAKELEIDRPPRIPVFLSSEQHMTLPSQAIPLSLRK